jgi:hypothetical protein
LCTHVAWQIAYTPLSTREAADRTLTPRVISLLRVSSAFGVIGARPHKDTHTQRVGGGASERERETFDMPLIDGKCERGLSLGQVYAHGFVCRY